MSTSYDQLLENVIDLAGDIQCLSQRDVYEYTPIVDEILRTNNRSRRQIEHTLDRLLDFCGYAPMVTLYRRLCRHYWSIDPSATAFYVQAYWDMWDSE
jgi:hypothetical protein